MAKILIIDDDRDLVHAMKVVLETRQHQIIIASNGREGLRKAKEEKPDLVMLDVMMDTMDEGFEIAREVKKDAKLKEIPILMLTAIKDRTGLSFEKEARDPDWLPVDDYCEKPLEPDELISKVETLLRKRGGE